MESQKNWLIAFLLCWFGGSLGFHQFYLGRYGWGVLQLLTLGGLGLWAFVDLIIIICGEFKDSEGKKITVKI